MEGGVAIVSKSAVLSGSATASACEQKGGVGPLFRNVFWRLARSIAPGDCLVSGDSRPHQKRGLWNYVTVTSSTDSIKWTRDSLG